MQPEHIAIIMDGNGRWAQARGLDRTAGHLEGAAAVRRVVRHARELNLPWLTLFAFSSMNWGRPTSEVNALMSLLERFLVEQEAELVAQGIRLNAIGERAFLPAGVRAVLERVERATAHLDGMRLTLAISYDGRRDLVSAVRHLTDLANRGLLLPADVHESLVMGALSTKDMPDVDLLVRTSGERRLSGFLPFEACYAELAFIDDCWPDFSAEHLDAIVEEYTERQRRFGLTAAQIY